MQKSRSKLSAILYSIRPSACIGAGMIAIMGLQPTEFSSEALLVFVGAFACSAFCFLVNDYFDRDKDLLNKKQRPFATGEISVVEGLFVSAVFLAVFVATSLVLGGVSMIICLVSTLLIISYSYVNNRTGIVANIMVALTVVLCFGYGAILSKVDLQQAALAGTIFFVTIAREIMLDWLDMEGDKQYGKPSVPLQLGTKGAIWVMAINYLIGTIFLAYMVSTTSDQPAFVLFLLAVLSIWMPMIFVFRKPGHKSILLNVRTSHLILLFVFLARVF